MKLQGSAFLIKYNEQGDFLSDIIIEDETLALHVANESKGQSLEWRHSSSPSVKDKIQAYFVFHSKNRISKEFVS